MRCTTLSILEEELEIVSGEMENKEILDEKGRFELSANLESFWKQKKKRIIDSIRQSQDVKAVYFGGESASYSGKRRHLLFLRLSGLYCDKVVIRDPFLEALRADDPEHRSELLIGALLLLRNIQQADLDWVVVVPPIGAWDGKVCDQIIDIANKDSRNPLIRKSILYKEPRDEYWVRYRDQLLTKESSRLKLPQRKIKSLLVRNIAFDVNSVLLESKILDMIPMTDHSAFSEALGTIAKHRFTADTTHDIDRTVLRGMMHLELPVLAGEIPLKKLGELRKKEDEAFRVFRQTMRECFDDLKEVEDPTQLLRRSVQVQKDIIAPAMKRLDNSYKRLRARAIVSGISFGVTTLPALISAICWQSGYFMTSIIPSIVSGLSFTIDMLNLNELKGNQFYFLWKLHR